MEEDPAQSAIIGQLILIAVLTMINAYFAAGEMAIVSVNKNKIRHMAEEGNPKAILVQQLLQEPTKFLSTIQVAITLAGFFNSASAATGISVSLGAFLEQFSIPYAQTVAMVVVTILLAFITLIFGELVPKRIALNKAEAYAMFCARPILLVSRITSPFIHILSGSTKLVLRLFGMKDENTEESLSREEIRLLVEDGQETGILNETETEMINGVFAFDERIAEQVMTPRTDVFCIDIEDPIEDYLDELMEMQYTRVPVYQDSKDHVIGILHMKDFTVAAYHQGFQNVDIKTILRKPYFVLESKSINELFEEMQNMHQHIAILLDEYGGFSGIVTIEDLIEEIMGDIEDEYDEEEPLIVSLGDHAYQIEGRILLEELNEQLDLELESENHETLSGLLLDALGTIPEVGEQPVVTIDNLSFQIQDVREQRIEKVRLQLPDDIEEPSQIEK